MERGPPIPKLLAKPWMKWFKTDVIANLQSLVIGLKRIDHKMLKCELEVEKMRKSIYYAIDKIKIVKYSLFKY
jgi:hypothetical protein